MLIIKMEVKLHIFSELEKISYSCTILHLDRNIRLLGLLKKKAEVNFKKCFNIIPQYFSWYPSHFTQKLICMNGFKQSDIRVPF